MEFLTQADLLALINQQELDIISDETAARIDAAELMAIEEINSHLHQRFNKADIFNTAGGRNALIVMYCIDCTLYHLHASIMPENVPELRQLRYDQALKWLEKVADGFITPSISPKTDENGEKTKVMRYGSGTKQNFYF